MKYSRKLWKSSESQIPQNSSRWGRWIPFQPVVSKANLFSESSIRYNDVIYNHVKFPFTEKDVVRFIDLNLPKVRYIFPGYKYPIHFYSNVMVGSQNRWIPSAYSSLWPVGSAKFVGHGGWISFRLFVNIVSWMRTMAPVLPGMDWPFTHITLCSVLMRSTCTPIILRNLFPMLPGIFLPFHTRDIPLLPIQPGRRWVFVWPWVAGIPLNPQRFMTPWKPRSILQKPRRWAYSNSQYIIPKLYSTNKCIKSLTWIQPHRRNHQHGSGLHPMEYQATVSRWAWRKTGPNAVSAKHLSLRTGHNTP